MRPVRALVFVLIVAARAAAQLPNTPIGPYFRANLIALSFLQSSSSDWSAGPQNFIAAKVAVRERIPDTLGPLRIVSTLTLDLGIRQTDDSDDVPVRVGENEMFGESRWTWPCGWSMDPYVCASFRTPITESFLYAPVFMRTGNMWDPVVSFESTGLQYTHCVPDAVLTARAGLALKQTRAHDNTLLTDNPYTSAVERFKSESGLEIVSEAAWQQDSMWTYDGKFGLFTTFLAPSVWTVRWENELHIRIWKVVGFTVVLRVVHDPEQDTRTQFNESAMVTIFGG